jgi:toxin-antitoxin system PIN domain toxin
VPASLFDTNLWLALTFPRHQFRKQAQSYLSDLPKGASVGFCHATQQSWLRLVTTPALHRIYDFPPITNHDALALFRHWLSDSRVEMIEAEPVGTRQLWLQLADRKTASPKLWMDAYLAAFAISGKLSLVTTDKDFSQFEKHGLDFHLLSN